MDIKVIKRDGSKEDFSLEKIRKVVLAAGLTGANADTLVKNVEAWVNTTNKSEISSLEIRDRVIKELQDLDPYAANMFSWYQKTKEETS